MEMERINEDTILFRIDNKDLRDRGTSIPDLLSNPGEIEEFFHSILVEMDVIDQFEDSDGMSFQVMPSPEGLELYVTRLMNDMEMDESEQMVKSLVDTLQHSLGKRMGQKRKRPAIQEEEEVQEPQPLDVTMYFDSFEDFIALAKNYPYAVQLSTLYRYDDLYFLHVYQPANAGEDFLTDLAMLREYGEFSRISWEVLQEYGQVVMADNAFETAKQYF